MNNIKQSKMSLNGGEHVVLAEVHSPEMQLNAPDKEYEATELHKVSTTAQSQEVLESSTADNPTPSEEPQLGQRIRKLTEKGKELHDEQVKKVANRFSVCYEKWKVATKEANQAVSGGQCSDEQLNDYIIKVCNVSRSVDAVYDDWKRIDFPDNNTRHRVDTCETVTRKIVNDAMVLLDKRAEAHRRARGQTLDERVIEEILSVASEKTVISSHRSRCSAASRKSAAAEIAATEATLEVLLEQERHIEEHRRDLKLKPR